MSAENLGNTDKVHRKADLHRAIVRTNQVGGNTLPTRSSITVQTYEISSDIADAILGRTLQNELRAVRRPALPIIYTDRDTLERMR